MKVANHNVFIGENLKQENRQQEKKNAAGEKNSLFAGGLNQDLFENKLLQKKKEAQQKALKVVGDAFGADRKIDDDLEERRQKIADLEGENRNLQKQVAEISSWQEEYRQQCGVAADSREQKELELLRKKDRWLMGKGEALTQEEFEEVQKLQSEGLTEYQKRQREWDAQKKHFQSEIEENNKVILEENAIIRGTRMERLKHDPMVQAQKEADRIQEAAGKEILGMIADEAKDTVDQKSEETEEKAEKLEEKREEQEALLEKQKERKEEAEKLLEDLPVREMLDMGQLKEEIRQEVRKIASEMKLVAEDIKGSMVDESL